MWLVVSFHPVYVFVIVVVVVSTTVILLPVGYSRVPERMIKESEKRIKRPMNEFVVSPVKYPKTNITTATAVNVRNNSSIIGSLYVVVSLHYPEDV
jgi:hypothetical protein